MPRLAQPFGSTSIEVNKQSIARYFGVKQSEVIYFAAGVDLGGYKVIYDKLQQRAYSLPTGISAGTTAISLSSAGVLVHSAGSVDLGALAVTREEFVTLPGSFTSGATLNVKNELLVYLNSKYRWGGAFPKTIPANSTPASTGGIGPTAWIFSDTAGLRAELASGVGDTMVGNQLDYNGAVAVTQRSRNNLNPSVLDFGADRTGINDSTAAFNAAVAAVPASTNLLIPSGTYKLNSDIAGNNHKVTLMEPVTFTGTGKFIRATVTRIMPDGTERISQWAKPGSTEYMTSSAVFGDLGATATGIQIGGAVPHNGTDGAMLFSDGSSGWVGLRASKWPHPTELAIYPSTRAGVCRTIAGGNAVKVLSGASIQASDVGKPISIYDVLYTVLGITADGFTVKNINGTAVTWPSTASHTFITCYYQGAGVCAVSGTSVTRISGDPFVVPDPTVPQTMTIGGVDYRVVAFTDPQHVTLNAAPGDSASTEYSFWGTVNSLNSALRVHRLNAAGFEENISIIANNAGFYQIHAAASNPANEQYPIFIGCGWDAATGGQMKKSLIAAGNGDVTLGGTYGVGPLYVPYATGETSKPQIKIDNSTGSATVSVLASTTDASLTLLAKGNGRVVVHSELAVNAAAYPYIDNVYTCGRSGNRWTQVWATNGVIQTSDERLKIFDKLSEAELKCGLILAMDVKKFRWKDKSDDLYHFGVLAQRVISVFRDNGLDALEYGVVMYDQDADIYSVSYNELNSLCLAALADKLLG